MRVPLDSHDQNLTRASNASLLLQRTHLLVASIHPSKPPVIGIYPVQFVLIA
jgi:hypothetical protein